jgi:hypothetical protein
MKSLQMTEYRRKLHGTPDQPPAPATRTLPTLAEEYGLQDMMQFDNQTFEEKTVDQEFQSYASGNLTVKFDCLHFWEVCGSCTLCISVLNLGGSSTNTSFRPFLL